MKQLLLIATLMLGGCASYTYTVTTGDTSRTVKIRKYLDRTDIGEIEMVAPDGTKVTIKGYSHDGTKTMDKLLDKIPNVPLVPIIP
jgi:uncharacterized protein YxeA